MAETKKYILDANCFIEPWNKFYSYDFFDSFWDNFVKTSCDNKIILVQEEIYEEIMKKSDELNSWVKKQGFEVVKTDPEITRIAAKIQNQFPGLVGHRFRSFTYKPFSRHHTGCSELFVI
jgi:TRAP-type C4-dicarboxylate transport system substrate-binding protein